MSQFQIVFGKISTQLKVYLDNMLRNILSHYGTSRFGSTITSDKGPLSLTYQISIELDKLYITKTLNLTVELAKEEIDNKIIFLLEKDKNRLNSLLKINKKEYLIYLEQYDTNKLHYILENVWTSYIYFQIERVNEYSEDYK